MARLSEVTGDKELNISLFLKFSTEKWHLESLQSGNIRMNNLKTFIDLERADGKKGMGDIHEVTHVMNQFDFQLRNFDANDYIRKY